jgi:hypothetical protein
MTEEDKTDYLEVDDNLPGQNYVCLSFISPESMIDSKEAFKVSKFLQSYCKDADLKIDDVMKKYTDYTYKYQEELQKDFDEKNKFQTNVRGLKVRGTYSTREEAEKRAKTLQSLDSEFHVFVGQVGYWLPWDPCADKVQDEHYINDQLNEMMEKYKDNNINRDIFYEEEKREKIKAAKEETIKKKKEELQKQKENEGVEPVAEVEETPSKVNDILDIETITEEVAPPSSAEEVAPRSSAEEVAPRSSAEEVAPRVEEVEKVVADVEKVVADVEKVVADVEKVVADVEKVVADVVTPSAGEEAEGDILNDGVIGEDMKGSLEGVDPWLANKMKQ